MWKRLVGSREAVYLPSASRVNLGTCFILEMINVLSRKCANMPLYSAPAIDFKRSWRWDCSSEQGLGHPRVLTSTMTAHESLFRKPASSHPPASRVNGSGVKRGHSLEEPDRGLFCYHSYPAFEASRHLEPAFPTSRATHGRGLQQDFPL